ncbi:HAMP domain-containing sensor histidine kinase [Rhodococcus sp. WAY2]|uniref:HAMP domain-containing sensor histidine kinase n=1 Tax=Rhodococcus sp. WAY2 TaxID=2663121 RepID=UPI0013591A89|nr:ATP-binding protein [Rhodococcus sp. WAY2]
MRSLGLRGRLLVAQLLVLLVGAVILTAVASMVATPLFRIHLSAAGVDNPTVRSHVEQAFALTVATALSAGAAFALTAATVASWLLVRRITAPVSRLVAAADDVAHGRYTFSAKAFGADEDFARLERAFADMAGRLDRTERTRAQMLADLAHELRTPVATLDAYLEGLEDAVLPADGSSWDVMRNQLDRLRRLASDMADLSAVDENALVLNLQEVDLSQVVSAAAAAAAPRFADEDIALSVRLSHLPVLPLDRQRIEQVLANLLENALRHTPAGGAVTISTALADPEHVQISVQDTGDGIPADQLEAVFGRFHRLDPARRPDGSGLGLTIARSLVRAHGGALTAFSEGRGHGARLDLVLPVAPAEFP